MKTNGEPITLKEYLTKKVPASKISKEAGKQLWQQFGDKITVTEPSFKNEDQWELTSQGWVGFIAFSDELSFYLEPKIPLTNLFGMWEYAYRLNSFHFLPNIYQSRDLQQFYEQLAQVLAKRILDRSRKGLYRAYISRTEDLSYLRGRMDLHQVINKPWEPRPRCSYQENTADIEENQILAWTLYTILRSGFCSENGSSVVRHCYRTVGQLTSLQSFIPKDCLGRFYNRLNQDYEPLHGLCRFFLENSGPSYEIGDRTMFPFLVNMAGLFELFVAEWLRVHLPPQFEINAQEQHAIGENGEITFKIDLVISDALTRRPLCVLDTKYKDAETPSSADIAQVNLYAGLKGCQEAILIYPKPIPHALDETVKDTRIRTTYFSLDGDLEVAGQKFMADIIKPYLNISRT